MSRSLLYAGLSAAAIIGAMAVTIRLAEAAEDKSLTVVSWGGAYTKSQVEAYHKPFTAETGIAVVNADYNGGIAEVKAQVESGNVVWDVVDMEVGDALRACDEGLLEPLDPASFPAGDDGTPAAEDFYPDALNECWATTIIFSTVFAFDDSKIGPNKPNTIGDFFDLQKFPGKRGLRKQNPKATLEMALIADGVVPEDVYEVLASPEGLDRAFAKLDTIKDSVVWWEAGSQPVQLLADGEVAMTVVYNGRLFDAVAAEGKPFKIVWDAQVMEYDTYVVVKGAPNKEAAMAFMRFATATRQLAAQASWIAYAPARKSSLPLVGKNAANGEDMLPNLPTPDKGRAVTVDPRFWADHQDEINQRWAAWLAQ
ncbi:MAG: ABC transporter substrate-binding protein [Alphaproteobacteria bacterium]|nr:ABC transporter substrate-binding protein [Alphaproteobacteria bacterium]